MVKIGPNPNFEDRHRQQPLLVRGPMTGRVYVLLRYERNALGDIQAIERADVTEDFNRLLSEDAELRLASDVLEIIATYLTSPTRFSGINLNLAQARIAATEIVAALRADQVGEPG